MFGLLRRNNQEQDPQQEVLYSSLMRERRRPLVNENKSVSNKSGYVQREAQPRRPLERPKWRSRERPKPARDEADRDYYNHDDQRSSRQARLDQERLSREKLLDDMEERWEKAMMAVWNKHAKSTTTLPSLGDDTTSKGQTSENVQQTSENMQQTSENVQQTSENVQQTSENMQQTSENVQQTSENTQQTCESSSLVMKETCSKEEQAIPKPQADKPLSIIQESKGETFISDYCANESFMCHGRKQIANEVPMVLKDKAENNIQEKEEVSDSLPSSDQTPPAGSDLLVSREILNVQTKGGGNEQRENLFRTRCLVQNKVCSLIIDGGSCTNVASTTMVKKLCLETKKHPEPYKLQWLTNNGEMKVTRQVTVSLSIGSYVDEILCDVLPMEASHILLGRPWQYDHQVTYKGLTNRYSFKFKGRKITLVPLSPLEAVRDQQHLSKKEYQNESTTMKKHNAFLQRSVTSRCSLSFSQSDFVLDNKKTCEEITCLEPVKPSSNISVSQVQEENIPEEAQRSVPLSIDVEQHTNSVPKPVPKSFSYDYPKHCKEIDLVIKEYNLFVLVSSQDEKRFGLENKKEICVSKPVFDSIIQSCEKFKSEKLFVPNYFLFNDMLDKLHGSCVISRIDFLSSYHKTRMKKSYEWKTVFKTKHGLLERLVMSFDLANVPSKLMRFLNHVLSRFTGIFVDYLNDIMVYSKHLDGHAEYLKLVLDVLSEGKSFALKGTTCCIYNFVFLVVRAKDMQAEEMKVPRPKTWKHLWLMDSDDYHKNLNPVSNYPSKEELFEYAFGIYDFVSLVFVKVQDKQVKDFATRAMKTLVFTKQERLKDQFQKKASKANWKYLRKTISTTQGSSLPTHYFIYDHLIVCWNFSFISNLFLLEIGTSDLRTNPFQEGGHDRFMDRTGRPDPYPGRPVLKILMERADPDVHSSKGKHFTPPNNQYEHFSRVSSYLVRIGSRDGRGSLILYHGEMVRPPEQSKMFNSFLKELNADYYKWAVTICTLFPHPWFCPNGFSRKGFNEANWFTCSKPILKLLQGKQFGDAFSGLIQATLDRKRCIIHLGMLATKTSLFLT